MEFNGRSVLCLPQSIVSYVRIRCRSLNLVGGVRMNVRMSVFDPRLPHNF